MGAHSKNPRKGAVRSALEWALVLVAVVVATQLVRAFVAEPYFVPTGSMEATIMPGDSLIAEKLSLRLGRAAERGDIVVFENPDAADGHDVLVKRVIATGGQTVDLVEGSDGAWRVSVDGEVLEEPYAQGPSMPLVSSVHYPFTVPEGHVWLMGDNRGNSADSRVFGAVDEDALIGTVVWRYWPWDRFGAVG